MRVPLSSELHATLKPAKDGEISYLVRIESSRAVVRLSLCEINCDVYVVGLAIPGMVLMSDFYQVSVCPGAFQAESAGLSEADALHPKPIFDLLASHSGL